MGGQSFKCPICRKWFLVKGGLHQHINDKHHIHNFLIIGVGPATEIIPNLGAPASDFDIEVEDGPQC